jgi:hypothetical protein
MQQKKRWALLAVCMCPFAGAVGQTELSACILSAEGVALEELTNHDICHFDDSQSAKAGRHNNAFLRALEAQLVADNRKCPIPR